MDRFFDLSNSIALKHQEIQYKFVDGVNYLLKNYSSDLERGTGIAKLYKIKEYYEQQLKESANDPIRVKDINICFMCFNKGDKPCTDCD